MRSAFVASLLFCASVLHGALIYTGGTYTQNFDTLANSPENTTVAWVDNSTVAGWYSDETVYRIEDGTQTNANLYSFGSVAATDRALGSIAGSSTGVVFYGLQLLNSSGSTYDRFNISYTGEQWRQTADAQNVLDFQYSLTATSVSSSLGYTTVAPISFAAPKFGTATGSLDGNLAANQVALGGQVLLGGNWTPGNTLWLRWRDPDDTGSDQGLSVDNLSVQFFPEPAAAMLVAASAGVLAMRRRR